MKKKPFKRARRFVITAIMAAFVLYVIAVTTSVWLVDHFNY